MSEKSKTIQQKMNDLTELVDWFQGDSFVLEESVEKFKQAELLAKEIEQDLNSIKNDIKIVRDNFDS